MKCELRCRRGWLFHSTAQHSTARDMAPGTTTGDENGLGGCLGRYFHTTPIPGTTLRDFPHGCVECRFQIMRLLPSYRNHFSRHLTLLFPALLMHRHRHHIVSREPEDDWLYLFS